jgi:uncharacterized ParB-like nuclease family protein
MSVVLQDEKVKKIDLALEEIMRMVEPKLSQRRVNPSRKTMMTKIMKMMMTAMSGTIKNNTLVLCHFRN